MVNILQFDNFAGTTALERLVNGTRNGLLLQTLLQNLIGFALEFSGRKKYQRFAVIQDVSKLARREIGREGYGNAVATQYRKQCHCLVSVRPDGRYQAWISVAPT